MTTAGLSAYVAAAAALLLWAAGTTLAGPVVQTDGGKVEGAAKATGVDSFLGIPYAAPPVGDLRWRPPGPAASWLGVRTATAFSRDCIQEPQASSPGTGFNNPISEDCLYLNIWRPAGREMKPLPVMVWIYGGAFIMGAGSFPSYDGTAFAREGVILVTFNYRLGRFGFFAHPALSHEQAGRPLVNYGLMDQIAALTWVRTNIASFGGDPGNVTILGESAGAASVNFLMTSPLARGLFAKAISESGPDEAGLRSLPQAEVLGKAWADKMGAGDLAALRALPAGKVWDGPVTTVVSPAVDGMVVVASTDEAFRSGSVARTPYLEGFNSREESLLRWLPGVDEHWFQGLGKRGPALLRLYTVDGLDHRPAVAKLWGEAAMAVPARARARDVAGRAGKVWLYRYGYVPNAAQGTVTGAGHDAEMEMVFKNRDMRWPGDWSDADAAMARMMNAYWVNFAKWGNPNGTGLATWPAYTHETDVLMSFGRDGTTPIQGFGKARLDAIEAIKTSALAP